MRITNIYTAFAAEPGWVLGGYGCPVSSATLKNDAAYAWLMVPGSCAEVSPLAADFLYFFLIIIFPEALRAFEIGLLKVSQLESIIPALSWSFKAWSCLVSFSRCSERHVENWV